MLKRLVPKLVLSAKRSVWRMNDHAGDDADKQFQALRQPVLDASGNACEFCTFVSSKFQEVHHGDDDHTNNARDNLFCACPLCHQVFHLGMASMRDGGEMVYLPELQQAEINQLALLIWVIESTYDLYEAKKYAFANDTEKEYFLRIRELVVEVKGKIQLRRTPLLLRMSAYIKANKDRFGGIEPKNSDFSPALFANALMAAPDDAYAKREDALGGLRLMPSKVRFESRVAHWRDEANAVLPVPAWPKILSDDVFRDLIVSVGQSLGEVEKQLGA